MDYYYSCVSSAQIKVQPNKPIALSSVFGWIICGCYENSKSVYSNICHILRVNIEICYSNYEINSENACDSSDNNFNNKLTLPAPCISESWIKIKTNLNFYFHTSLRCLKRLYEGLKGLKGLHKTF